MVSLHFFLLVLDPFFQAIKVTWALVSYSSGSCLHLDLLMASSSFLFLLHIYAIGFLGQSPGRGTMDHN